MSTETPTLDELVKSMHEQAALLTIASKMEAVGQGDLRDELVRQQLCRTAELLRGAAALGASQNAACLGILSRSLLEQLITSLWSIRSIENAQAHHGAAKMELAKAMRINLKAGKAKIKDKLTGLDVTTKFLETEQMKGIPRRKSVEEQAKEAEVLDIYTVFYRFMSLETHGHSIASQETSETSALCEVQLQGIGAISRAVGQACVWWLLHRGWPDNESIRSVLGLNSAEP